MILRAEYIIHPEFYQEALRYARSSRAYTSNRHDFHAGGLSNKQKKCLKENLEKKDSKCFY